MEAIIALLGKLDYTAIIASVVTFVIGLSILKPRLSKVVLVLEEVAELVSYLKESLEDGKISKEEVDGIFKEVNELIAEVKK